MPPGKVRVGLGAEVGSSSATPALSVRVGVAPRAEVRGKVALGGGELGVNAHVVDGEQLDLMLMPQAFYYDVDDAFDEEVGSNVVGFGMPAVASVSFETEHAPTQVFIAPDLRVGGRDTYSGRYGFGAVGVHVGFAVSGRRDYGTFIPECAWFVGVFGPNATQEDVGEQRFFARNEQSWTCSLGVGFGPSRDQTATPAPKPSR